MQSVTVSNIIIVFQKFSFCSTYADILLKDKRKQNHNYNKHRDFVCYSYTFKKVSKCL